MHVITSEPRSVARRPKEFIQKPKNGSYTMESVQQPMSAAASASAPMSEKSFGFNSTQYKAPSFQKAAETKVSSVQAPSTPKFAATSRSSGPSTEPSGTIPKSRSNIPAMDRKEGKISPVAAGHSQEVQFVGTPSPEKLPLARPPDNTPGNPKNSSTDWIAARHYINPSTGNLNQQTFQYLDFTPVESRDELRPPGPYYPYTPTNGTTPDSSHLCRTTGSLVHGQILGERVVEREVRIPKLIRTEETVERLQTTNEIRRSEEIVEETQIVKEKVRGVKKPIIKEKFVEVPEIEYRELPPKEIIKIVERPQITIEERIIEVPKHIEQRRIVEVMEVEFREQPVERIVEVPEIQEEIQLVERKVPQIVEREVREIIEVEDELLINRQIPIPMEHVTVIDYELPVIDPEVEIVDVPIFVPRFIEVACPVEMLSANAVEEIENYANELRGLALGAAVTLSEVDVLAQKIKEISQKINLLEGAEVNKAIQALWAKEELVIEHEERLACPQKNRYEERMGANANFQMQQSMLRELYCEYSEERNQDTEAICRGDGRLEAVPGEHHDTVECVG